MNSFVSLLAGACALAAASAGATEISVGFPLNQQPFLSADGAAPVFRGVIEQDPEAVAPTPRLTHRNAFAEPFDLQSPMLVAQNASPGSSFSAFDQVVFFTFYEDGVLRLEEGLPDGVRSFVELRPMLIDFNAQAFETPAPAAALLFATALGGLFWRRRAR